MILILMCGSLDDRDGKIDVWLDLLVENNDDFKIWGKNDGKWGLRK